MFTIKQQQQDNSQIALRSTSQLQALSIVLFGGRLAKGEDNRILTIDKWIPYFFRRNQDQATICNFRRQLDRYLRYNFSKIGATLLEDLMLESDAHSAMSQAVALYWRPLVSNTTVLMIPAHLHPPIEPTRTLKPSTMLRTQDMASVIAK